MVVLTDHLTGMGFRCAIGDYWIAYRLDYLSRGRVTASSYPREVRFRRDLRAIVSEPGHYVELATPGSKLDRRDRSDRTHWRREVFQDVVIYAPVDTIQLQRSRRASDARC
jgi:hypothetical protein